MAETVTLLRPYFFNFNLGNILKYRKKLSCFGKHMFSVTLSIYVISFMNIEKRLIRFLGVLWDDVDYCKISFFQIC